MARLPRLPDLLTTANLACGVGSILLASQGQLTWACWLVFAGAVFDVFDGLAARALGQGGSEFGKQLDSLADMVTFGVAPATAFFFMVKAHALDDFPLDPDGHHIVSRLSQPLELHIALWTTMLAAILITAASAWRLAKFNLDTRQTTGFLGLPTPANGLFWASVVLGAHGVAVHSGPGVAQFRNASLQLFLHPFALLALTILMAALMLSELPLPSLKFKHFKWKGNEVIFLLIGIGLVLVLAYGILAVPLILVLYLLSPLWGKVFGASSHKPQAPSSTE